MKWRLADKNNKFYITFITRPVNSILWFLMLLFSRLLSPTICYCSCVYLSNCINYTRLSFLLQMSKTTVVSYKVMVPLELLLLLLPALTLLLLTLVHQLENGELRAVEYWIGSSSLRNIMVKKFSPSELTIHSHMAESILCVSEVGMEWRLKVKKRKKSNKEANRKGKWLVHNTFHLGHLSLTKCIIPFILFYLVFHSLCVLKLCSHIVFQGLIHHIYVFQFFSLLFSFIPHNLWYGASLRLVSSFFVVFTRYWYSLRRFTCYEKWA